jgi:hypothetical protein
MRKVHLLAALAIAATVLAASPALGAGILLVGVGLLTRRISR